jgi:hypothetical protein
MSAWPMTIREARRRARRTNTELSPAIPTFRAATARVGVVLWAGAVFHRLFHRHHRSRLLCPREPASRRSAKPRGPPRGAHARAQRWKSPINSLRWRSLNPPTVFDGAIRHWVRQRVALAGPIFGNASRRS